jgi:hypothetical protein
VRFDCGERVRQREYVSKSRANDLEAVLAAYAGGILEDTRNKLIVASLE